MLVLPKKNEKKGGRADDARERTTKIRQMVAVRRDNTSAVDGSAKRKKKDDKDGD